MAQKNESLFQHGVNFNDVPVWQRWGTGLYWESYEKEGFDPVLGRKVSTSRRRVRVDGDLPMKEAYDRFLSKLLQNRTI